MLMEIHDPAVRHGSGRPDYGERAASVLTGILNGIDDTGTEPATTDVRSRGPL